MRAGKTISVWILLLIGLNSCRPGFTPPTSATASSTDPFTAPQNAQLLSVFPTHSFVIAVTDTDGALAALGHLHTIRWPIDHGRIWLTPQLVGSSAELQVVVANAKVDEPEDHRQMGLTRPRPDKKARVDTRRNLLSAAVLDAEQFPFIRIRAKIEEKLTDNCFQTKVWLELKGRRILRQWPICGQAKAQTWMIESCLDEQQQALGLLPFSALGGLMRVADTIRLCFHLEARGH